MASLIALEASSDTCSVAVLHNNKLFSQISTTPRSHAKVMLPMLNMLLEESGLTLSATDAIAVTHGPGSFTGIRICFAVMQGLALGRKIKIVPVSSLELLAFQALQSSLETHKSNNSNCFIVPALDARMGEIYWGVFRKNGAELIEIEKPKASSSTAIGQYLLNIGNLASCVGVGNGWGVKSMADIKLDARDEKLAPHAQSLIRIAELRLLQGKGSTIGEVEPLYVRNEVSWNKRTRVRDRL